MVFFFLSLVTSFLVFAFFLLLFFTDKVEKKLKMSTNKLTKKKRFGWATKDNESALKCQGDMH